MHVSVQEAAANAANAARQQEREIKDCKYHDIECGENSVTVFCSDWANMARLVNPRRNCSKRN